MTRARARRGERGTTIVEVMIAIFILGVAGLGFAGMSQYAASSTGIGHRRTTAALMRGALIDRMNVTPRSVLRTVAAASESTWIIDSCFARSGVRIGQNTTYSTAYTCPTSSNPEASTYYRSWIRITDNGTDAWAAATNSWAIGVYVERVEPGCLAANRYASVACLGADLLLTD